MSIDNRQLVLFQLWRPQSRLWRGPWSTSTMDAQGPVLHEASAHAVHFFRRTHRRLCNAREREREREKHTQTHTDTHTTHTGTNTHTHTHRPPNADTPHRSQTHTFACTPHGPLGVCRCVCVCVRMCVCEGRAFANRLFFFVVAG